MKKSNLNENNFEVAHVTTVLVQNGYVERQSDDYNQELFLDSGILLTFVKNTITNWISLLTMTLNIAWGDSEKAD